VLTRRESLPELGQLGEPGFELGEPCPGGVLEEGEHAEQHPEPFGAPASSEATLVASASALARSTW
jgi:hypothetical protein